MSKTPSFTDRKVTLKILYDWADRFTEFGPSNTVGARVIERIKDKLDEAYEKGFKEGMRARRPSSSSNLHG